jgi:hypothetical protein
MKLVDNITDRAAALAALNPQQIQHGLVLFDKGYMPKPAYCTEKGVDVVRFLERAFAESESDVPKGKVNRFLDLMESMFDYMPAETANVDRYMETRRHKDLILKLGYAKSYAIFRFLRDNQIKEDAVPVTRDAIAAARGRARAARSSSGFISVHDLTSNLPAIRAEDDPDALFSAIMNVLRYNSEKALDILQYINYARVREAKNAEEALKHIALVKAARGGISKSSEMPAYAAIKDIYPSDDWCAFSKEAHIVATVGGETNCCFTKGGAAGRLLDPAMRSPIAGVLHGTKPSRWFSFVWELVVREDNMFWKCIVLDNVEARGTIPTDCWERIAARLGALDYRRIYCGSLRNDVDFSRYMKMLYPSNGIPAKPYSLVGYETCFGGSDDSRNILVVADRQPFTAEDLERGRAELPGILEKLPKDRDILEYHPKGDEHGKWEYKVPGTSRTLKMTLAAAVQAFGSISRDVVLRRMNQGDLHRCKYIEKQLYSEPDRDFTKHDVSRSPSMVMESAHAIYGYMLTSVQWVPKTAAFSKPGTEWYRTAKEHPPKASERSNYWRVLYLDDLWCIPYAKCICAFRQGIEYLAGWCHENRIDAVVASTNKFSAGLAERLKAHGLRYEEVPEGANPGERVKPNRLYSPTSVTLELGEPVCQWVEKSAEEADDKQGQPGAEAKADPGAAAAFEGDDDDELDDELGEED